MKFPIILPTGKLEFWSGFPERFACTKASGLAPAVSSAPGMALTLQQGYSKATGLVGGFNPSEKYARQIGSFP